MLSCDSLKRLTPARLGALVAGAMAATIATSCDDAMQDYYAEPDWIKGSIYEVLEAQGDYTLFLQGAERAGWAPLLQGRSILTVMAPDDASMRSYLQAHYATTDPAQLTPDEARRLIGFHLLYYNFDKQKLINFRPLEGDGATEEDKNTNAGLYYKFRTRSQDAPEHRSVAYVMADGVADSTATEVDVYHFERFIPVFSHRMFQTLLLDARYNYEYFFPETPWSGDAADMGLNVASAQLTQAEPDLAKNGSLYYVDRVIEPMGTIHDALEQRSAEYGRFLSFYDEALYWEQDADVTQLYGGQGEAARTYYTPRYGSGRPNIAQEWSVANYALVAQLASGGCSVFAPTDAAYDQFYRDYWGFEGTGWPLEVSWDTVRAESPMAIQYLMQNCYSPQLAFPEQIKAGDVLNPEGIAIQFPVDEVPASGRQVCVNGFLYGLSELTPPAALGSVTGPTFQYRRFSQFASMVSADVLRSLSEVTDVSYVMLYPSNRLLAASGIGLRPDLGEGLYRGSDRLGARAASDLANAHIIRVEGGEAALPADDGYHVYNTYTQASGKHRLYVYVHGGRVTNCYLFDQLLRYAGSPEVGEDDLYSTVDELTFRGEPWSNGRCYEYDTDTYSHLLEADPSYVLPTASFTRLMSAHAADEGTLFQGFIGVLRAADLLDTDGTVNFLTSTEHYVMFIPTTDALREAIAQGRFGVGPSSAEPLLRVAEGTAADDPDFWSRLEVTEAGSVMVSTNFNRLQCYMQQYFLPDETYNYTEYPYVGFVRPGEVAGEPVASVVDMTSTPASNAFVYIHDSGSSLSVQAGDAMGPVGQPVDVDARYHYLPFIFNDGCVHFITGVLDNVWPYENY